ncbi:neutral zinc metallopeptidase [Wenzhouxiangella sp. XN24]|uniref:KPN_02809 family neutral zinc metallopeptidase n=1 Tax=Wenzhouxiangella sp. XN24 TaxID=2713569 RepID=UPI0013E9CA69|nr:neutral zinc metallopeptidase [Wenzhouxiangella sp. XN24]NGX17180.1 metalloprotease [Wenzhouxiangella sp. XN24]
MKWKGRRGSTNVEDVRGRRVVARAGGLGMLLNLVGRTFGMKGVLVLLVLGLVGWQMGLLDPATLMGGSQVKETAYQPSPEEQERFEFVRVVLADTEDIWAREFKRVGGQYQAPELVVYSRQYPTACGMGDARMGPFYCPADRKIYIDLTFYDELARTFEAPGDFAQAYVIAHEVGHHVQNLLGISGQVAALRGRPEYNQHSVRLELQADYLAGVWAHHNRQYLERGDIEEAMQAANQIGDDAIQLRTQGRVVPHAFTHGSSEQRMRWFRRGLESGRIEEGGTFEMPFERL